MILANKKIGETPLELINRIKESQPVLKDKPLTYAGRLDPLAKGLMLILEGEEVHKKPQYLKLPKIYQTTFLFGIETDTYDPLGLIQNTKIPNSLKRVELKKTVEELKKRTTFPYPPYSAKPVKGKPLWQWAREGNLSQITIPKHKSKIKNFKLKQIIHTPLKKLMPEIKNKINSVKGDFRQTEILKDWQILATKHNNDLLSLAKLSFSVSSGTYIRQIAQLTGKHLSLGAIAFEIKRTKIGHFTLKE